MNGLQQFRIWLRFAEMFSSKVDKIGFSILSFGFKSSVPKFWFMSINYAHQDTTGTFILNSANCFKVVRGY
jgi:hypothetical protein